MICTVAQFNAYSGNFNSDTDTVALKTNYLMAAEEKVISYLGYDPAQSTRTDIVSGIGDSSLYLKCGHIDNVQTLKINGVTVDLSNVTNCLDHLESADGSDIFTQGKNNITCTYVGGWLVIPDAIQLCILRIATLLLGESNGNIGVTSRTYEDNSRTFIQYTNWSKYLDAISSYRVMRF